MNSPDPVKAPSYYNRGKIECHDAIESAVIGLSGIEAVDTGCAIKYLWRWKYKNGIQDLQKAKEYIKGHLALGMEGSDDVVGHLVTQEVVRQAIMLPKERDRMIDRVTVKDILRVAQDIFQNNKLNMAVIGPHAHHKELEKILSFPL